MAEQAEFTQDETDEAALLAQKSDGAGQAVVAVLQNEERQECY